ncbi:ATP-binding protein [Salmonirosea aquatica]|uniref:histidine kinase n=1 Tax=Salmonirosea aquatica TaxID=2654236 RepID=A0A7C9FXC1_9BACT|nr:GAF domain-containing protein [Cytophagaceae bacterium SJW1-29]
MIDLTNHTVATITDCDQEPIHIPGSIQPHGYLLAVDSETGTITHGSANLSELFRIPLQSILGNNILHFFPDQQDELRDYLELKENFQSKRLLTRLQGREYLLNAHRVDATCRIVELERWSDEASDSLQIADLLDLIKIPNNLTELCQILAEHFRKTLGYDRIMIYRFDQEDFTGEVLAESLSEGLEPYLGLRYPASDIPQQARELYLKNSLRSINDTFYEPVALYGLPDAHGTAQQLDLSLAYLRSVSPIHIQYLKNMGVASSLSIAIVIGNRLWGLIACHHSAPRHLTIKQRDSAQLLGMLLSSQIELHERNDSSAYARGVEEKLHRLLPALDQNELGIGEIIIRPELLEIADASGVAILTDGLVYTHGGTPSSDAIKNLAFFLSERTQHKGFSSKNLAGLYPEAEQFADSASGILYQPLSYLNEDCILWFRPGIEQTINWAGRPKGTSAQLDVSQRLTPRNSFSAWQETVRNVSRRWLPVHKQATEYLASVLQKQLRLLQLQQEADKQRALNEKLKAATEELENINWISMHDLKEPLRKIQVLASRVLSREAQSLTESLLDSINRMHNSAMRMQKLLDDVSAYSHISSQNELIEPVDLNRLLADIIREKDQAIRSQKGFIHYEHLPTIRGVQFQLKQLMLNLIDNALKFSKPDEALYITVRSTVPTAEALLESGIGFDQYLAVSVKDNGVGFNRDYRDIIFKLFKRLNNDTSGHKEGTGIGLAICKKVMMNHEGYIWVDSELGQGTEFQLLFPKARIKES